MKKTLRIALFALVLILTLACFALADGVKSGDYTYEVQPDGSAAITLWEGSAQTLRIPETLDGHTVTIIKREAFDDCDVLVSVTIPGTVMSIEQWAFDFCSNLQEVNFSDGVTSLATDSFFSCTSLRTVTLPNSIRIEDGNPFDGCDMLEEIRVSADHPTLKVVDGALYSKDGQTLLALPCGIGYTRFSVAAGTRTIANSALAWNPSLVSVTLPDSMRLIDRWAFSYCQSLTTVQLPSGLERIGNYAFDNCSALESLTIPAGTEIGNNALPAEAPKLTVTVEAGSAAETYCRQNNIRFITAGASAQPSAPASEFTYELTNGRATITGWTGSGSTLTVPAQVDGYPVVKIGSGAFSNNRDLENVTIASGVTSIEAEAFMGCENITSINLPDTLTSIGNWTFERCNSLLSITLPDSVKTIGACPFMYCQRLTSINVSPNHPVLEVVDGVLFDKTTKTLICYPYAYASRDYVIPAGTREIARWAFYGCENIRSITIPEGVTSIGNVAFQGCNQLTSIVVPEGVTKLGFGVFENCKSLTSITLPASLTTIGNTLFTGCPTDLIVTVPSGSYAETYCREEGVQIAAPGAPAVPTVTEAPAVLPDASTPTEAPSRINIWGR